MADILRVPQEYVSIQDALDNVSVNDTILVATGTYIESLTAPSHFFVLRGDVTPDSLNDLRPVIDPTDLPNSNTIPCMQFPDSSSALIEHLVFRNGPAMLFERTWNTVGGIRTYSGKLTVKYCRFDSVYIGIGMDGDLRLTSCRFEDNFRACAFSSDGSIRAEDCLFSGNCDATQVWCDDSSSFVSCHFRDNASGAILLRADDTAIEIRQCIFGPSGPHVWSAIEFIAGRGCVIENNIFTNLQLGPAALKIWVYCYLADSLPILISGNQFSGNTVTNGQGLGGIEIHCSSSDPSGYLGHVENNTFEDNDAYLGLASGIAITTSGGGLSAERNRFAHQEHDSLPAFRRFSGNDEILLLNNLIETSFAVATNGALIDASENWWGHPSGPYHPSNNPMGLGGEVSDNVIFDRWHTDTLFFTDAPEPRRPLPLEPALEIYPNPFNSTATIKFIVGEPGIFKIDLFNTLGQFITQVWSGPALGEHQIILDTNALNIPSGIYFLRVRQPIFNRTVALSKVVLLK